MQDHGLLWHLFAILGMVCFGSFVLVMIVAGVVAIRNPRKSQFDGI